MADDTIAWGDFKSSGISLQICCHKSLTTSRVYFFAFLFLTYNSSGSIFCAVGSIFNALGWKTK